MRNSLALTLLLVAGCGGGGGFVVSGQTLKPVETNYGGKVTTGSGGGTIFCSNLDIRGQFMVVLSDKAICDALKADGGAKTAFHGQGETNLRMIFPSTLTKVPADNKFDVGEGDCQNVQAPNTEAVAFFDHNDGDAGAYTTAVKASSGTITVTYPDTMNKLTGSFNINFATGENATGTFEALLCNGITPGTGN